MENDQDSCSVAVRGGGRGSVGCTGSRDHEAKDIEVVHARAPAMNEADTKSTAMYMTIKNRSSAGDRLIGARARFTSKVEIHEPGKESKSVAAVTIDAGKDLELGSTGHYLF
jgi:copper(I)-binding protein